MGEAATPAPEAAPRARPSFAVSVPPDTPEVPNLFQSRIPNPNVNQSKIANPDIVPSSIRTKALNSLLLHWGVRLRCSQHMGIRQCPILTVSPRKFKWFHPTCSALNAAHDVLSLHALDLYLLKACSSCLLSRIRQSHASGLVN